MKKLVILVAMVLLSAVSYAQDNTVVKDTIVFAKPSARKQLTCYSTGKYVTLVTKRGPEEVFTNGKSYWVNRVSKDGKEYKCYLTKEQKALFISTYGK